VALAARGGHHPRAEGATVVLSTRGEAGIEARIAALLGGTDGGRATTRVAVVGASADRRKFGNIILRDLVRKGFTVIPVNPGEAEVEGLRAYASVADVPGGVHIADLVVPPAVGARALAALDPAAVEVVWLQPGAFDPALVALAEARFGAVVAGPCIMVEAR
jgi:predicted CoA-binding protein